MMAVLHQLAMVILISMNKYENVSKTAPPPRKRETQTSHAHADTLSVRVTIYIPRSGPTQVTRGPKCDCGYGSVHWDVGSKKA